MIPVAYQMFHFFLMIIVPMIVIVRVVNLMKTQLNGESIFYLNRVDMDKSVDLSQCQVADQDCNERYVQF